MDAAKYTKESGAKQKGVRLYLRVHVMPKLNMPLRGKAWQWIVPVAALGLVVVALIYYFSE